eukprot:442035_1
MSQEQKQDKVNAKQSVQIRLMKSQINSIFKIFNRILQHVHKGNTDQQAMIGYNDSAVAALDLFGANCEMWSDEKQTNVLIAGWAHFDARRKSLKNIQDQKIINEWLIYMDCALGEKPLPSLQITQDTIQRGKQNVLNRMPDILSKIVGAQHKTHTMAEDARVNNDIYQEKDQVIIKNAQQPYEQMKQQNVKIPTQDSMYKFSGGVKNKNFGPASVQNHGAKDFDNDEKDSDNDVPIQNKSESTYANSFIKEKPNKTISDANNNLLKINYPFPCEIVQQIGDECKVRFAAPNRNIGAMLHKRFIERDPTKVSSFEEYYVSNLCKNGLGYPSIKEKKEKNNIVYQ